MGNIMIQDKHKDYLCTEVGAVSEGNPGALNVLMRFFMDAPEDLEKKHYELVFSYLKTSGITGPAIWLVYKDICGEEIAKFSALLLASMLGAYSGLPGLVEIARTQGRHAVQDNIPDFGVLAIDILDNLTKVMDKSLN